MNTYEQIREIRNERFYGRDNIIKAFTPFRLGCDVEIDNNGDRGIYINEFDVEDDTQQNNINVLLPDGEIIQSSSWFLNYNRNNGMPVSLDDILRLLSMKIKCKPNLVSLMLGMKKLPENSQKDWADLFGNIVIGKEIKDQSSDTLKCILNLIK